MPATNQPRRVSLETNHAVNPGYFDDVCLEIPAGGTIHVVPIFDGGAPIIGLTCFSIERTALQA